MTDIFISYKSERRPAADHLAAILRHHGYSVWVDYEGLRPGEGFEARLEEKVKSARAVLVLWCRLAVESPWVAKEAEWAKATGSYIPIWIEDAALPAAFRGDHTLALTGWSGEPISGALRPLLRTIAEKVGRPARLDDDALDREQASWERFGRRTLAALVAVPANPNPAAAPWRPRVSTATGEGVRLTDDLPRPMFRPATEPPGRAPADEAAKLIGPCPRGLEESWRKSWEKATQGDLDGLDTVGFLFCEPDLSAVRIDRKKAITIYEFAAKHGSARALGSLAHLHHMGQGVEEDKSKAARLYAEAALKGDGYSATSLAPYCLEGRGGMPKDPALALSTIVAAADSGSEIAKDKLAGWLARGANGIAKDEAAAIELWREIAASGTYGHSSAKSELLKRGLSWL